jgi:signal transduction histidine kinase
MGRRLPARTIRLRMTLLYSAVFLVTGAVLLTIGYALVRHNLFAGSDNYRAELHRLGLAPPPVAGHFPGLRSSYNRFGAAIRDQLRAQALNRLLIEYIGALAAMTLVSVAAGWLLAGRVLRPLRHITATARRVSGENLGERIDLQGPADELKELADTFDGMLGRLDAAFASQRHFVANASHELRTPLAVMRTEIDVTLDDPDADADELRAMGEAVRDSIDRCERLIASLLFLARSEAVTGHEEPVDMASLAADCLTDMRARAQEAAVEMRSDLQAAWVTGEPGLVERMIANLLDNAIRHNQPGGFLDVRTERAGALVRLRVANSGRQIDPDEVAGLTEPFRRLNRRAEGFGLGLSIVRSVAEAHGGRMQLSARAAGGLEVVIELPALPVAPTVGVAQSSRALTRS